MSVYAGTLIEDIENKLKKKASTKSNYYKNRFNKNDTYLNQFKPLSFDSTNNFDSNYNDNHLNWSSYNKNSSNYNVVSKEDFENVNLEPSFKNNGSIINDYNQQNINHKMNLFTGKMSEYMKKKRS